MFNNNIRCIEMKISKEYYRQFQQFNNNIRCIEIKDDLGEDYDELGLITT